MIDYDRPKIRFLTPVSPLESSTRVRILKIMEYLRKNHEIADLMDFTVSLEEPAFNILVVQKYHNQSTINLVDRLKLKGVITVYDIVDKYDNDPTISQMLNKVDAIIVDCEAQKEYCKQLVPNKNLDITIIPDSVDYIDEPIPKIESQKEITKTNNLNIVFFASPSNLNCMEICKEALVRLGKEKKFTLTYISGEEHPEYFNGLEIPTNFIKWNPYTFSMDLRKFDLTILPQKREKGDSKLVQAITHNLPAVSSNIESYRQIAEQTGTTEFLCKTSDEWYDALVKMFNPETRFNFLNRTVGWVWSNCGIVDIIHKYKEFFTRLLIEKRGMTYNYDTIQINIRLAEQKDIDEIVMLSEEWHPVHNETEREIRKETLRETLGKEGHEIFVAENGGKIIGWFDVRVYKDWFMLRYAVHVEHIFVTSAYRRIKVGSMILQKIIKYYENLGEQLNMNIVFFYSEGSVDSFFEKNGFYTSQQRFFIRKKSIGDKKPLGVD